MDKSIETLARLIEEKVAEGLFVSVDDAVTAISGWLEELERHYLEEQMRNEDA